MISSCPERTFIYNVHYHLICWSQVSYIYSVGGYVITGNGAIPFNLGPDGSKSSEAKAASVKKGSAYKRKPGELLAPKAGAVDQQTNNAVNDSRKQAKIQNEVVKSPTETEVAEYPPSAFTLEGTGMCLHTLPLYWLGE